MRYIWCLNLHRIEVYDSMVGTDANILAHLSMWPIPYPAKSREWRFLAVQGIGKRALIIFTEN